MTRRRTADALTSRPRVNGGARHCDHPGCDASGDFPAPRSRDALREYYWFCLEHVRSYNAGWNYYAGMDEAEIERHIRADTTWWRPTWPLGVNGGRRNRIRLDEPGIDFGAFGQEDWDRERIRTEHAANGGWRPRPGSDEAEALAILDLEPPVTKDSVKARYKALVKRHHPDANGGNREAEERLKVINRAYSVLRARRDF